MNLRPQSETDMRDKNGLPIAGARRRQRDGEFQEIPLLDF